MISLGGVIGTGLFLSTGYTLSQAGPGGTIAAYLIGGLMMYLVMQCLGELSVAMPVTGSFQTYATTFIGPSTGFMVGIMYWVNWVVTVGSEFTASGILMQRWFPHSSVWMWSAIFAALLFAANAFSVKLFAETEFWFSSVKIVTILLFIILGGAAMFGLISLHGSGEAPMLSNFTSHGGLFPNGFLAVFIAMISVSFAFSGTELIGITAGETANPAKDIPRSIRNVAWRTVIFFIGAIFVLSGLISWKEAGVIESPFVAVFSQIGIPYAADIMNFVILTALLSVANSGLYASTRMLWSLANENMISARFKKVTPKGISAECPARQHGRFLHILDLKHRRPGHGLRSARGNSRICRRRGVDEHRPVSALISKTLCEKRRTRRGSDLPHTVIPSRSDRRCDLMFRFMRRPCI